MNEEINFDLSYQKAEAEYMQAQEDGTVTEQMERSFNILQAEAELRLSKHELVTSRNGRVFFKCLIVLMLQMLLAGLAIQYFWTLQTVMVPAFFNNAGIVNICLIYCHL